MAFSRLIVISVVVALLRILVIVFTGVKLCGSNKINFLLPLAVPYLPLEDPQFSTPVASPHLCRDLLHQVHPPPSLLASIPNQKLLISMTLSSTRQLLWQ
jgi:hypothetical protein